ncbi:hypothetical protein HDU96_008219 [Phlyctochytrium bullatum]|nr:hypothetical protein HDU96_008219 [Phlyctochytrium bullatum]
MRFPCTIALASLLFLSPGSAVAASANVEKAKDLIQQAINILGTVNSSNAAAAANLMAAASNLQGNAPAAAANPSTSSPPAQLQSGDKASDAQTAMNDLTQMLGDDALKAATGDTTTTTTTTTPPAAPEPTPSAAPEEDDDDQDDTPTPGVAPTVCGTSQLQVILTANMRAVYGVDGRPVSVHSIVPVQRVCMALPDEACRSVCSSACAEIRKANVRGGKTADVAAMGRAVDAFNARLGIQTNFASEPLMIGSN